MDCSEQLRCIVNTFTPVPKNPRSHVRGYALAWAHLLEAEILTRNEEIPSSNTTFYWDHGVNTDETKPIQFIGGPQPDMVARCNALADAVENGCRVVPLRWRMKDEIYYNSLLKRSTDVYSKADVDRWRQTWMNPEANPLQMKYVCGVSEGWTVGDSHVLAFADKGDGIHMLMGQTLHGALKNGNNSLIDWYRKQEPHLQMIAKHSRLRLSLGSVDIRHHVLRHGEKPAEMAKRYVEQAVRLARVTKLLVELCPPVPVETEGRRIPKTGWHKGSPFYGSMAERRKWTMDFITALQNQTQESRVRIVIPPDWWYYCSAEEWEKRGMELSSSVHVAPTNYKSNNGSAGWQIK